jgi:hypothetical protein
MAIRSSLRSLSRDPRSSPIGIGAFLLSVAGSYAYFVGVARPVANGTIANLLDDPTHNAEIMVTIFASGVSILLSVLSLALERAALPGLLSLLLLIAVEKELLIMMPVWTVMVARWGLGLLYGVGLIVVFVLLLRRMVTRWNFRENLH